MENTTFSQSLPGVLEEWVSSRRNAVVEINSFSTFGNYSQPAGKLLLSTLVDTTSYNDIIKYAALRWLCKSVQTK